MSEKATEVPLVYLRRANARAAVELVIADKDNQTTIINLRPSQLRGIIQDGIKFCFPHSEWEKMWSRPFDHPELI